MSTPDHTAPVFSRVSRQGILLWATDKIRDLNPDAIVVCGQSGIILGTLLSDRLNIPLVVVRKDGEPTRAGFTSVNYYGHGNFKRWLFVDDLIASSSTFRHVYTEAHRSGAVESKRPAAILLYCSYRHDYNDSEIGTVPVISAYFEPENPNPKPRN